MAIIKQIGAPTRKTKGAIGDIYIDTKTGNRYKCTFSYLVNGECDCAWALDKGVTVDVVEAKPKQAVVKESKPVVEEPAVVQESVEAMVEEPVEEPAVEETKDISKPRTNYVKQYQKPNKN